MSFYREDPQWFRARASRHSENLGEIAAQALEAAYAELDAKDALIAAAEEVFRTRAALDDALANGYNLVNVGISYNQAQAAYQSLRKP